MLWREPGERTWRRGMPDIVGPIGVPEFGIEFVLDEVYGGMSFD
jgi:hypothetical protein